MNTENDSFVRKLAEQLDASSNDLDMRTRTRLRGMRRRAIEQLAPKPSFWLRGAPVLALASAAAVALAVALWPNPASEPARTTVSTPAVQPESVQIPTPEVVDDQDADEYPIAFEEDLEFYQWLEQQLGDS